MGKRQDESSKGKSIRSKKAVTAKAKAKTTKTTRALSSSEVIMTMTLEEAKAFLANFKAVRSRQARGRDEE